MIQQTLFDAPRRPPLPPHNRTDTSREAAEMVRDRAPPQREKIFRHIASRGPAGSTNDETEAATGLLSSSVSARCRGLVKSGHVRDSGARRPNCRGLNVIVWEWTGKPLEENPAA